MGIFWYAFAAVVSYGLTRLFFAIWAAPLLAFVIFMTVLGLMWLDGSPWFEVLASFQGILGLFGLVLGVGFFFGGSQIAGVMIFSFCFGLGFLLTPTQQRGEATAFNSTHENEMLVYDTQMGWNFEKLPLRHPGDRLIQVSEWQWNLADPEIFNEDYNHPNEHPTKLVETAPGRWEFVKREEAYSQEGTDKYGRPMTFWVAKVRSNVPVTDVTRPTTNPYYAAVHTKAEHTKEVAVKKTPSAKPSFLPSFFQNPFGIFCLIMGPLVLIAWIVSLFFPEKPQTVG